MQIIVRVTELIEVYNVHRCYSFSGHRSYTMFNMCKCEHSLSQIIAEEGEKQTQLEFRLFVSTEIDLFSIRIFSYGFLLLMILDISVFASASSR